MAPNDFAYADDPFGEELDPYAIPPPAQAVCQGSEVLTGEWYQMAGETQTQPLRTPASIHAGDVKSVPSLIYGF